MPLRRDPGLDAIAAHEVRAAALADQSKLDPDAARRAVEKLPGLESVMAQLMVRSAPEEVSGSKFNAEPRWTRLGVGAIYANSKQYGPGRLWVVLLYGR